MALDHPVQIFSAEHFNELFFGWACSAAPIHDPTTGEWYDVGYKDAPGWAKREARKRRELRKEDGVTRLLTAAEMEEVWEKEQALMWEQPAVTEKGIVYEDYINEED